jgi:hypothetical protein
VRTRVEPRWTDAVPHGLTVQVWLHGDRGSAWFVALVVASDRRAGTVTVVTERGQDIVGLGPGPDGRRREAQFTIADPGAVRVFRMPLCPARAA